MILNTPLLPRNPDGVLRVIIPGRISTPNQDLKSIASQQEEKKRIVARFDEELARLKALWAPGATTAATDTPLAR